MPSTRSMQIKDIISQIELGTIGLPEFQRGYVWNRDQVRQFMQSLYHRYPVGSLLEWVTPTRSARTRGDQASGDTAHLLLDGQQRITTLYGLQKGKPPQFFDGDEKAFTHLRFHLDREEFSFYQPLAMKNDPLWVDVTEILQKGAGGILMRFLGDPAHQAQAEKFLARLNRLAGILEIEMHIDQVTGADKTLDVVVDIFNRVNSSGRKLSQGDLALAKVCAHWPEARSEMKNHLARWAQAGFHFRIELLLRCVTTALTGDASFSTLDHHDTDRIRAGLSQTAAHMDTALNLIASRLGLDHDRVLGGRYALPILTRYLELSGGIVRNSNERDTLLYWYIHSFLWGRYANATESTLNQDLRLIEDLEGGLGRLIAQLRQVRGDLSVHADDFRDWSKGSRFYPLLYLLTRTWHSLDWETGIEIKEHLLGPQASMELHHIFPKSLLYGYRDGRGYQRPEVNALANFTFLTKHTNLQVSNRNPADYLAAYCEKDPTLLESHWIPLDPQLWRLENYPDFLAARRALLASATNRFLETLLKGVASAVPPRPRTPAIPPSAAAVPGGIAQEYEKDLLGEQNRWLAAKGLPEGELLWELIDENDGQVYGVLDLAWPHGLQEGLSSPVALLIDEPEATEAAANRAGFRYFTDVADFRAYVEREILAASSQPE